MRPLSDQAVQPDLKASDRIATALFVAITGKRLPAKVLASELHAIYGAPDPRTQAGYGGREWLEKLSKKIGRTVAYERAGRRVTNAVWRVS